MVAGANLLVQDLLLDFLRFLAAFVEAAEEVLLEAGRATAASVLAQEPAPVRLYEGREGEEIEEEVADDDLGDDEEAEELHQLAQV